MLRDVAHIVQTVFCQFLSFFKVDATFQTWWQCGRDDTSALLDRSKLIDHPDLADAKKKSWFLISGPELEEQKLLILRKEIQIHCTSDLTHEADQLKLQRCLRDQVTQDWVLVEVASYS